MTHLTIPDGDPTVTYAAQTGVGPFNVTFPITSASDLRVEVGGVEVFGFTFTSTDTVVGGYQAGVVTLAVAADEQDVHIWRDIPIVRTTDFATGPLSMPDLNTALDRLTAQVQDARYATDLRTSAAFLSTLFNSELELLGADRVRVIGEWGPFVSDGVTPSYTMLGTGTTLDHVNKVQVYTDGLRVSTATYTITPSGSNSILTFLTALPEGTIVHAFVGALQGQTGPDGEGVPAGGTAGQILQKINGTDFNTQWSSVATTAEYLANTADKILATDEVWAAAATVALTDAATIAVDMAAFLNATVTLGGNRTLGQPSNAKVGQSGFIRIVQDGTGSRTLAYHADWKFAGGTDPTLTTTAGATDVLFYHVIAANFIYGSLVKALA